MLRVALSGGIASGKTTVCEYFAEQGVPIIDADQVARELLTPGTEPFRKTVAWFGEEILDANGGLDRGKLRRVIFSDPIRRRQLEQLLHPLIYTQMTQRSRTLRADYCILCIPLLLETAMHKEYDRVIVIDLPRTMQLERLMARLGCGREEANNVIQAQADRQARLRIADDIIKNDKGLDVLKNQVVALHLLYKKLEHNSHG